MELDRYSSAEALRDGRTIEIRALRPTDRDALIAAVRRMSDESIYRRFFSPRRQFSEGEVDYYTNIDFSNHVALIAVLPDDARPVIAGGARYVVTQPGSAEVAFAVLDAYQGQGIGSLLMQHLFAIARRSGLERLTAEVLAGNAAMLNVFGKSGLHTSTRRERDIVQITLELA